MKEYIINIKTNETVFDCDVDKNNNFEYRFKQNGENVDFYIDNFKVDTWSNCNVEYAIEVTKQWKGYTILDEKII